jgi:two-component system LytT family response regulator
MKIRTIIAENEPLGVDAIRSSLAEIEAKFGKIEIVSVCRTGQDALDATTALKPDLLFLDIEMPDGDGMYVAEILQKRQSDDTPPIIFTTAHAHYAAEAFEVDAADYLLKPFSNKRLEDAINRALRRRNNSESKIVQPLPVPTLGGIELVQPDNIEWAEASGDYVEIFVSGRSLSLRMTLKTLSEKLNPILTRPHRSYLVNLKHIAQIVPAPKGEATLVMRSGKKIPVSRRYKSVIKEFR